MMAIEEWRSQIRRGTLEYCVLLMLGKKSRYGYEILQEMGRYPCIAAKEGTVYPLLRRLQREGYLSSAWQHSAEGLPPRRYYTLTAEGERYAAAISREWDSLLAAISGLNGER